MVGAQRREGTRIVICMLSFVLSHTRRTKQAGRCTHHHKCHRALSPIHIAVYIEIGCINIYMLLYATHMRHSQCLRSHMSCIHARAHLHTRQPAECSNWQQVYTDMARVHSIFIGPYYNYSTPYHVQVRCVCGGGVIAAAPFLLLSPSHLCRTHTPSLCLSFPCATGLLWRPLLM